MKQDDDENEMECCNGSEVCKKGCKCDMCKGDEMIREMNMMKDVVKGSPFVKSRNGR